MQLIYQTENKEEMKKKREEAFAKAEEKAKERDQKKAEEKRANEKFALKEIMKVKHVLFKYSTYYLNFTNMPFVSCANSVDSSQPAHAPCLIRIRKDWRLV